MVVSVSGAIEPGVSRNFQASEGAGFWGAGKHLDGGVEREASEVVQPGVH